MTRSFSQVDVFATEGLSGNPVAVVHDAQGLGDAEMRAFANWTNLSETTFLLPPTTDAADYRVRIFTPGDELPFAGHPTLGTAHAWRERGGEPRRPGAIVQECGIGLVTLRETASGGLAFAAPELARTGPLTDAELAHATAALRLDRSRVRAAEWIDNGPGWRGLLLESAEDVLGIEPDLAAFGDAKLTVIGPHAAGGPADFEVRAFAPGIGVGEDPVTGSANAGFAVWLTRTGRVDGAYTVRQGTALGRAGEVTVARDESGILWIGGVSRTIVRGEVAL